MSLRAIKLDNDQDQYKLILPEKRDQQITRINRQPKSRTRTTTTECNPHRACRTINRQLKLIDKKIDRQPNLINSQNKQTI